MIVIVSLDWTKPLLEHLGLNTRLAAVTAASCRKVVSELVQQHVTNTSVDDVDEYALSEHRFLTDISGRLDPSGVFYLSQWYTAFWGPFEGEVRDWYAYKMAFHLWYGWQRTSRHDDVPFNELNESVLRLFSDAYLEPTGLAEKKLENHARESLSTFDMEVLNWRGLRVNGAYDDTILDILPTIHEVLTRRYFQLFWTQLLTRMDRRILRQMRDAALKISRDREAYPPERDLPMPWELPLTALPTRV